MLHPDLEKSLSESEYSLRDFSPFQRILLTTDGTVTEILEAQFWEPVSLVKISQDQSPCNRALPGLDLQAGSEVIRRKILLQGAQSKTNYIYAKSILVPENLEQQLRYDLFNTDKPLGRLMLEAKTETFREILSCHVEAAGDLGEHFGLNRDSLLISRTYRVFAAQKPLMQITEKFPESAFRNI